MDKSKKLMSVFLSSALAVSLVGCSATQPKTKTTYDENGNPVEVVQEQRSGGGFFPFFMPFFGGFGGRGAGITNNPGRNITPNTGIQPGGTQGTIPNSGISSGAKGGLGSSGGSIGG